MASREKEFKSRANLAETCGVIAYVVAGLLLLATIISGGVLLHEGVSPLPAVFPLSGTGILAWIGKRALHRRDHWADAAYTERELAEDR